MRLLILISCLVTVIGCGGGGGGGGGGDTGGTNPLTRAEAFANEALMRAEDDAMIINCDTIVCPIADSDRDFDRGDGTIAHLCTYDCMESEIDASGEKRRFFVHLQWNRFLDGCFDPDARILLLLAENQQLCVPN